MSCPLERARRTNFTALQNNRSSSGRAAEGGERKHANKIGTSGRSSRTEDVDGSDADDFLKAKTIEQDRESTAAAELDTTLKETQQRLKDTETENIMLRIELKQMKREQEQS